MFRFFIDKSSPNCLSKEDEHHLFNVIRINKGECFELVSNDGYVHQYEVTSIKPHCYKEVAKYKEDTELNKQVTIFFALSKGDKQDLIIQKCTELGVNKIILVPSERSVFKINKDTLDKKLSRYNSIAKEAAMQCHRLIVPEVIILSSFNEINKYLRDINFVAYEKVAKELKPSLESIKDNNVNSISIYIGSEGGISDKEIAHLNTIGFKNISLGNRILRCETAAINVMSVIAYILENEKN